MDAIMGLLFLLIPVGILFLIIKKLDVAGRRSAPYEARKYLFTRAERSFFGVLESAVGGQYRVMGKVRVADVLKPRRGLNASDRTRALNRISSKHLDFVLCAPDTMAIVAAVELDDKSHERPDRARRDEFLDAAFAAAGIPLVHIPVRSGYALSELRERLAAGGVPLQASHAPRTSNMQ